MTVLIGIPTHKRPELLRQCLDSIAAQAGDLPDIAVFVADNDAAGHQGLDVVRQLATTFRFPLSGTTVAEPGISAVRNAILAEVERSGADFVAMIDDDETATPDWLLTLLKVQRETGADIVGAPTRYNFERPLSPAVERSGMFRRALRPTGPTPYLHASGNFLASAASLGSVGWPQFDPAFGLSGGEDVEWFRRLSRAGLRLAWAADAIVFENVPADRSTAQWVVRRAYRQGNSDMRVSMKEWPSTRMLTSLFKLSATVCATPFLIVVMLLPRWQVLAQVRWARAAGRVAAFLGTRYLEYASRHDGHVEAN